MDLETLIAQSSGKLPPGFVPQAVIRQEPPQCERAYQFVACRRTHSSLHHNAPHKVVTVGSISDEATATPREHSR